ncbi:nuclear transport factor 2 family protein [Actinomycetospora soli]|uniref:nuclear transport factor 2 family protein n=1 Tax=Actinomycetospora soli TaxID=2893887 RepID=UPI001E3F83FC|nr:nuclear transport factor 2 family protein [Actinomycetospora soli]MCD2191460.1 nuclear transport factor 2 family protein [Actinomycetospora soli]
MPDIESLVDATLRVFNERDPDARLRVMAEVYDRDIVFTDAEDTLRGHAAVSDKVQGLLDSAPGFDFTPDGPAHVLGDLIHAPWTFGPPDGEPVVRGVDMSLVADGKVVRLYTLLLGQAGG